MLSSPISCLLDSFQCVSVSLVLGSPNWVQCSSSSLRRARHRGKITSLNLLATFLFLFSAQYDIPHQITSPYEGNAELDDYADFKPLLFCQEERKPESEPSGISVLISSWLLAKFSILLWLTEVLKVSSSIMLLWDKSSLDAGYKCACWWQHNDLWVLKNQ